LINFSQQNGSNKRRKGTHCQEEVCRGTESCLESYADLSRELSIGSSSSARPPTSFLDLPDDILLPILEEFYEQRYESITRTTPLRIAEILVNKRIYLLARPLWYKRLSINEQQFDVRLAGLNEDDIRRSALLHLDVALTDSLSNLMRSVIVRLPRLTHLSIHGTISTSETAIFNFSQGVAKIKTLQLIGLWAKSGLGAIYDFYGQYHDQTPYSHPQFVCHDEGVLWLRGSDGNEDERHHTFMPESSWSNLPQSNWRGLRSLTLRSHNGRLPWDECILEHLESSVSTEDVRSFSFPIDS